MSYDLMVFERTTAPQKHKDFLEWYRKETEWKEEHGYNDPVIYAAFAWSVANEAYELTKALAQKHGVGFFDASGQKGDVYLPDGSLME